MSRYIALLRAINVGGARTVNMESLRRVFQSLGFSGVETFIASGNVVFETTARNTRTLEAKIEKRLRQALGYPVETFVRTDAELAQIANDQPFPQSEIDAGADVNILFLTDAPDAKTKQRLTALSNDTDKLLVHGREIYWLRRKKPGATTFSTTPLDKAAGVPFTIRGFRTVKKIAAKYCAGQS